MAKIIVLETSRNEEALEEYDHNDCIEIQIDGERRFKVHEGESEDNSLGRNFSDCYNVANMMQEMYEAGKSGKVVEFQYEEVEY